MVNYLDFYKSAKEYLIKIKSASEQDFKSVEESDILEIENLIGKKISSLLRCFLNIFGKTTKRIPDGLPINLDKIKDAYYKSSEKLSILESTDFKVYTDGKKIVDGKVVEIDDTIEGAHLEVVNLLELLDIEDFLFLSINENTTFINSKEEDPIIHYFIGTSALTSSMLPLSAHFRAMLFNEILPKLGWNPNIYKDKNGNLKNDLSPYYKELFRKISSIDISNLQWASIYDKIFMEGWPYDSQFPIHIFQERRREFYHINSIVEKQNGYILTIDEFEWKFIDFLKQQGYNL
ncbi:hypothetical protein VB264_18725 [Arcicella aquatica]|uniref:Uncharacterized protein n=1 Tax=Arcicella aquatica TaxID=217141 RepID=A0ABU5QSZ4_9BACT|nr:hypothetical protein [Arcicella aquatica]MEA5259839.1 hypothetical protein [Arcicella aquatica]